MAYDAPFSTITRRSPSLRGDASAALSLGSVGLAVAVFALVWSGGFGIETVVAAAVPYAIIAAIVLSRIETFHPHERFGAANGVTLARAIINCLLIGLLAGLLTGGDGVVAGWRVGAEWLFFAAAIFSLSLDGVDGFLARRQGLASRFGARFDVEIDAMLLSTLAIAAWTFGTAGPWVIAMGATYYAFLASRAVISWLRPDLPPSLLRKAVCVLQGAALIVLVTPFIPANLANVLAAVALSALWLSFGRDVLWLWRARQ
ncbi:MAG: CDP-alcohol phosphatidyltransferase [Salinarimonadaceae bacterium]|nr:MAG: CDP-alcohol phosphatidyltransferase [Salinarimonadaceae bacterium]